MSMTPTAALTHGSCRRSEAIVDSSATSAVMPASIQRPRQDQVCEGAQSLAASSNSAIWRWTEVSRRRKRKKFPIDGFERHSNAAHPSVHRANVYALDNYS